MWRGRPHFSFFFGGLNLEQVLAYRNCGEVDRTFLFFWVSEPGTGASLQKMWRGDRTFLFFLRSEPGTGAGRVDRKCGER